MSQQMDSVGIIQPEEVNKQTNKELSNNKGPTKFPRSDTTKDLIFQNGKLRHYNTVVTPEALYASETLRIDGTFKKH